MVELRVTYYMPEGLDPNYDENSANYIGHRDNKLILGKSCALNKSAKELLGIKDKKQRKLLVIFKDGTTEERTYDDTMGNENSGPGIDLFEMDVGPYNTTKAIVYLI